MDLSAIINNLEIASELYKDLLNFDQSKLEDIIEIFALRDQKNHICDVICRHCRVVRCRK